MKTYPFSLRQLLASIAVCGLSVINAAAQVPAPIAHWTFDEGINDFSTITSSDITQGPGPSVSDAIYQGTDGQTLVYGVGQIGGAAFLDGQFAPDPVTGIDPLDHFFSISEVPALDNATEASFAGWFQPAVDGQVGIDEFRGIFTTRDLTASQGADPDNTASNFGINFEDDTRVDSRVNNIAIDSPDGSVTNDGSWFHAVVVYNGGLLGTPERSLYLNGVLVGTDTAGVGGVPIPDFIVDSGSFQIGTDIIAANGDRAFRGGVDDFAIFGDALSATQVLELYNDGLGNGTTTTNASGIVTNNIIDGDVDGDGDADEFDYFVIRDALNSAVGGRDEGDVTNDGFVTLDDFAQWRNAAEPAALIAAGFAVPEPGSIVLLGLAGILSMGRRNRRSC